MGFVVDSGREPAGASCRGAGVWAEAAMSTDTLHKGFARRQSVDVRTISDTTRKGNGMELSSEDLRELQLALMLKRSEILGSVADIEESLRRNEPAETSASPLDMGNVGTADYDIGNTAFLLEHEQRIITEIDHCLQAIAEGAYGICDTCGHRIPSERLRAIPWTRCCMACAALAECSAPVQPVVSRKRPLAG